jgi:cation diffusion facilitator family transporter
VLAIVINLILFAAKFFVGRYLAFSIAIYADAMNNLADAGASLISLVSFRIASKPADRDHPFGHARMEYVTSMVVAFLVLHTALDLVFESISKLTGGAGEPSVFNFWTVAVLSGAILLKLLLCLVNRVVGKKMNSPIMMANAADSLSDCISTAAVLAVTVILFFFPDLYMLDAIVGLAVAAVIFVSGIKIFISTKNLILGESPDEEVVEAIVKTVKIYPDVCGIHDMFVHSYGTGSCIASFHVEVDGSKDIFESHDMVDNIERDIRDNFGYICTIHMDPIVTDDERSMHMRGIARQAVKEVDERLDIHDFRFVEGTTHTNLIFDVEVPFEVKMNNSEIILSINEKISQFSDKYFAVITVDRK